MPEIKDDPREVLALLNSLGFVGITAQQLKAFMKDLKMHRKIKERERQQWKEETKKKILSKQQSLYKEVLRELAKEIDANANFDSTTSVESSSYQEESLVRIKVLCTTEDKENQHGASTSSRCSPVKGTKQRAQRNFVESDYRYSNEPNGDSSSSIAETQQRVRRVRSRHKSDEADPSADRIAQKSATAERSGKELHRDERRCASAPNLETAETRRLRTKSAASASIGDTSPSRPFSRASTQSRIKSFIRPWRLNPKAQKYSSIRKTDPVALYQKYQEEWKRVSFPGEAHHARVRWAVREKMLGTDPHPRPVLTKSASLMAIKKR